MGKFTFTQTEIPGVVVIEPQVFGDDRGYFMETYQKDQFAEAGIDKEFVQDNQSRSIGTAMNIMDRAASTNPRGRNTRALLRSETLPIKNFDRA